MVRVGQKLYTGVGALKDGRNKMHIISMIGGYRNVPAVTGDQGKHISGIERG